MRDDALLVTAAPAGDSVAGTCFKSLCTRGNRDRERDGNVGLIGDFFMGVTVVYYFVETGLIYRSYRATTPLLLPYRTVPGDTPVTNTPCNQYRYWQLLPNDPHLGFHAHECHYATNREEQHENFRHCVHWVLHR